MLNYLVYIILRVKVEGILLLLFYAIMTVDI